MLCRHPNCGNFAESGKDECFKHRVASVGFTLKGSAMNGSSNWNRTASEWKREHLGTDDDRELAKRGIERA